jgi:hypothetical protein
MKAFGFSKVFSQQQHLFQSAGNGFLSTIGSYTNKHFMVRSLSSRLKITGAFLLVILLGLASLALRSTAATASQSRPASMDVPVSPTSATVPVSPPSTAAANDATTTTNTDSTTGNNGAASTSVTVNGQPVSVPANGSTQQTISSPGGNTKVSVSSTQSTDGNTDSSSLYQTNLNVSTSSTSSTTEDTASP